MDDNDLDEARRFLAHDELGPTYRRLVSAERQGLPRCSVTIAALASTPD